GPATVPPSSQSALCGEDRLDQPFGRAMFGALLGVSRWLVVADAATHKLDGLAIAVEIVDAGRTELEVPLELEAGVGVELALEVREQELADLTTGDVVAMPVASAAARAVMLIAPAHSRRLV